MTQEIQIVLYGNTGWIIEAIARQWASLIANGVPRARVTLVEGYPLPGADAYIHMTYLRAQPVPGARNLIYPTHINRWWHAARLLSLARKGVELVTMSHETRRLANAYVGNDSAVCICPKSIHFEVTSQQTNALTFGLFFRLYKDDRKSLASIQQLVQLADTHPELCRLVLYGKGLPALAKGFTHIRADISDAEFVRDEYEQKMRQCDYVLYFGSDEGAMSVVDATALQIPVLAIDQGFHRDLSLAPGSQLFQSTNEILSTIQGLCNAIEGSAGSADPATLFQNSIVNGRASMRVPVWRSALIPFIKNRFLLHRGNLSTSSAYAYRSLRKFVRKSSRVTLKISYSAIGRLLGEGSAKVVLQIIQRVSPRTYAELCAGAITAEANSPALSGGIGLALSKIELHKFAILHFEKAAVDHPEIAEAHFNLAECLAKLGDHSAAISSYNRAISLSPAFPEAIRKRDDALAEWRKREMVNRSEDPMSGRGLGSVAGVRD